MSSRLSRSSLFAALAFVGASACDCDPVDPDGGGEASLTAQFPRGTSVQSDGSSRLLVQLTARDAEREPLADPITVTVPAGGGFLATVGGDIVNGETLTATPDENGVLAFEYLCVPNAAASISLSATNEAATASLSLTCTPPQGDIIIDVDDDDCDNFQALPGDTCSIALTISQNANGVSIPKAGPVTIRVVDTTPDAASGGEAAIVAADGGTVGLEQITVNADDEGAAVFTIVAPAIAETATLEIEFDGFVLTREVVIDAFENRASIVFTPATLNVTGGVPATVEVAVLAANGDPAVGGTLASITIQGGDGTGTLTAGGTTGETLEDVVLDNAGAVALTVNTPVVDSETAFSVVVVFEAVANLEPRVETLVVTASEEGALLLNLSADPAFLKSDGVGAERTTTVTIQFSQNGPVANGTLTVTIPGDSTPLIAFADDLDAAALVLDETDFDAEGFTEVEVVVVDGVPPGFARIVATGEDDAGNSITEELSIEIQRDPVLQAISFVSVTPNSPLAAQGSGGALPPAAIVQFRLIDDRGNPMPNVAVTFRRNTTAPADVIVAAGPEVSDSAGLVSTVVAAGTQPGPVTVIATALDVFGQSTPIPIVGGLASFETSFLECDGTALREPYTVNCSASIVNRFSNTINGVFVQFNAESGNEEAAVTTAGGVASVEIGSSGLASLTDILGWSYAIVLPNTPDDLAGNGVGFTDADAADCFDASTSTVCDIVKLCNDPDAGILCPLPSDVDPGACLAEADIALAVLADPPSVIEFATSAAERQRVTNYLGAHRACGFPIGCFTGQRAGLALDVADGDECPANAGCFDFTAATECPQDGVRTIIASTRGAEAFSDINGNGVFDFEDDDGDRVHDENEAPIDAFVDLPEPFLDRNDNCFRDDLTNNERFDSREILKVLNTDQFLDVSSNNVFGFDTNNGLQETNGVWDPDTQIFLTEQILAVGDADLATGEKCALAGQTHACRDGSTAACVETAGGNFARCGGLEALSLANPSTTVSFRYADGNGNCPSPGFALRATTATDGEIKVTGNTDVALSESACGFGEAFNPILPYCSSMPALGAPIFTIAIDRDCEQDEPATPGANVTEIATVTFSLGGVEIGSANVAVTCPVAPAG